MSDHPIFTVGGTVQAGGGIYLPRPADDELLRHCLDGDFCYVLTARQMGKSSLMVRAAERLEEAGTRAVIIDLTRLGTTLQADQWYLGLLDELVEQLDLQVDYKAWWQAHAHLGPTHRLGRFLRETVLEALDSPLVIFIDEIDTTLSLSFSDDFFAAIRACYNARSTDPAYKRLSFVLLGVATPGDLIRDPQRTPFNIGQRIDLTDFTLEQALPLAEGFANCELRITNPQSPITNPEESKVETLKLVLSWTNGHPYLTQRLCRALVDANRTEWDEVSVAEVVEQTFFGEKSKQDGNLGFVRDMLTLRAPERYKLTILQLLRDIHKGRKIKDEEQAIPKMHLKLAGIARREGEQLVLRNKIYARVFDQDWLKQNWPVSWKQRGLYAGALVLMVIIGLGLSNLYAAQIREPRIQAEGSLSILAQEPPVELQEAEKAAAFLELWRRRAASQNIFIKLLWGRQLDDFIAYADPAVPLKNYYERRFAWLVNDFTLPDPTRLRLLSLHEMATMGDGLYRQQTLKFLVSLSAEGRRSVWELADISAQSQQVEAIFTAIYPEAEYAKEPGVLAFLAEGALRLNLPDLAGQALGSLRAMAPHQDDTETKTISAGSFKMGGDPQVALAECKKYYDSAQCDSWMSYWNAESPIHAVTLASFVMDAYEVTNAAYTRCVAAGVCAAPASNGSYTREKYYDDPVFADFPVIYVSWYDAMTYCSWRGARLPTEAEWEYAARGGLEGQNYPWGDIFEDGQANFCDTNCSWEWANKDINDGYPDTSPVGSYPPNGYGLYDMAGNVWEWVNDWYSPEYYATVGDEVFNPPGPTEGDFRVLRGGSWFYDPYVLRVSNRFRNYPSGRDDDVGFRCSR